MLKLPTLLQYYRPALSRCTSTLTSASPVLQALSRRYNVSTDDCWRSVLFTSRCLFIRPADVLATLREEASTLWARGRQTRPRRPVSEPRPSPKSSSSATEEPKNEQTTGEESQQPNNEDLRERLKKLFAVSLFLYGLLYILSGGQGGDVGAQSTTWSDFTTKLLPTGQISRIVVFPERDLAFIYLYAGAKSADGTPLAPLYQLGIPSVQRFESEVRAAETAISLPPELWTQIQYKRLEGVVSFMQLMFIFGIICLGFWLYKNVKVSFKMTDMLSPFTKAKYRIWDPHSATSKLAIKFKDVAGLHQAKVEINEFTEYLSNPGKYTRLGARLPKGALLTGPPGCGKTLLAKALAAESSAPFLSMNGTEFIEMIGGLGASRMRDLFKEAKARAPCIIYIDEIDAIGQNRGKGESSFGGTTGEQEQTLNQLLVEMDGMDTNQGIVIIASTNRPDILDKALTRRGRFDRHISIDLPTVVERQEHFELYLKKIKILNRPADLAQRLAQMTPGFSGADIANIVNEAAIHAASNRHRFVSVGDLHYALEKVIAGPEKRSRSVTGTQSHLSTVAYHEAGHAVAGWFLEHADPLLKVSIIPRVRGLGYAQYLPKEQYLYSKEQLFDRMCMALGGSVAEMLFFNCTTTGAQNDFEKVTEMAYNQVVKYGMSDRLGPLSFDRQQRGEMVGAKPYSQATSKLMDEEVRALVQRASKYTRELLGKHRESVEKVAQRLLEKEVLSSSDMEELIGKRPFPFPQRKTYEASVAGSVSVS